MLPLLHVAERLIIYMRIELHWRWLLCNKKKYWQWLFVQSWTQTHDSERNLRHTCLLAAVLSPSHTSIPIVYSLHFKLITFVTWNMQSNILYHNLVWFRCCFDNSLPWRVSKEQFYCCFTTTKCVQQCF